MSSHFSPRTLLHLDPLNYDHECRYTFGEYVQAPNERSIRNDMGIRTLDCIYVRPSGNRTGGHEVFHLATKRVITRHTLTSVPMPDAVIAQVEAMSKIKGLKMLTRQGRPLFDPTMIHMRKDSADDDITEDPSLAGVEDGNDLPNEPEDEEASKDEEREQEDH